MGSAPTHFVVQVKADGKWATVQRFQNQNEAVKAFRSYFDPDAEAVRLGAGTPVEGKLKWKVIQQRQVELSQNISEEVDFTNGVKSKKMFSEKYFVHNHIILAIFIIAFNHFMDNGTIPSFISFGLIMCGGAIVFMSNISSVKLKNWLRQNDYPSWVYEKKIATVCYGFSLLALGALSGELISGKSELMQMLLNNTPVTRDVKNDGQIISSDSPRHINTIAAETEENYEGGTVNIPPSVTNDLAKSNGVCQEIGVHSMMIGTALLCRGSFSKNELHTILEAEKEVLKKACGIDHYADFFRYSLANVRNNKINCDSQDSRYFINSMKQIK